MDRKNFKNQIFTELPDLIICSNFRNCTFKVGTKFERCNLIECVFEADCEFDRSNVIEHEEDLLYTEDQDPEIDA